MENEKIIEKLAIDLAETNKDIVALQADIIKAVSDLQRQLADKQKKDNEIREAIKIAMRDNGVKKFENDLISLTYVSPTTRVSIDTAKLKEEKPEIWRAYSKETEVSDSIRIKIKELALGE